MVKKILKFGVSGGSAALINLIVFFLLNKVFDYNYYLSALVSYLISASIHFAMQKFWVFQGGESSAKSEGILFFISSILNLVGNQILLFIFADKLNIDSFISQLISLGLLACINYILYETIVFKKSSAFAHKIHDFLTGL